MQGFIGGSFARYIRGEESHYNDIDMYFDYNQLPELISHLTSIGVAISEHNGNGVIWCSTIHNNMDIIVFQPDFEYETEQVMGFTLLTSETIDNIYRYAASIK
ncbi:MAG: hypothetical protein N4A72_10885 [Bacteroidales bacterium]|jgi:hypothetical protein|nr:hypothetical protein [Bacteroidales bacterium]